jgi:hypothetical protein
VRSSETNEELPIFCDFEASSFRGDPVEVAWSMPDGRIESYLIRPAPHWTDWSPEAEAVHGISRETLRAEGRPVEEVAARMNEALAGRVVLTDAPEFDERWCARLFDAAGLETRFRFDQAFSAIPAVPGRMPELFAEARARSGPAHRAANDVRFLLELFRLSVAASRDAG